MHLLVVFGGFVLISAVASAQTFVNPQLRQAFGKQLNIPQIIGNGTGGKRGGKYVQQPLYMTQHDGINPQFNGNNPQGGQLAYNFKRDYKNLINPRNPMSDWRWAESSPAEEYVADGATFLRQGFSSVEFVSLPYNQHVQPNKQHGRLGGLSIYEGVVVNKQNFTVLQDQQLTVRLTFACDLFNEEDSPYPDNVVSDDDDDPTLANCGVSLASYGDSSLVFSIVATDEGIWAVYERNRFELVSHPERPDRVFTIFHKIGKRRSPFEIIDAGIEYDNRDNKVYYYIDNQVVHTIDNLGTLPPNSTYKGAYTQDRQDFRVVEPKDFQVWFGLYDYLDEYDPNNENNTKFLRTQRLVDSETGDDYYDEKVEFYDNIGKEENNLWGQGAVQTLYDILIKLEPANNDKTLDDVDEYRGGGGGGGGSGSGSHIGVGVVLLNITKKHNDNN